MGTKDRSAIAETYSRFPVVFVKGQGPYLWDENGEKYLDFASGIAVCSLGHCHPDVTRAIQEQAATLVHTSNLYWTEPQIELAQQIVANSFAERVFFCNSGAEAVEAALKLARRRGHDLKGPDCYEVICLEGSFHGRTLATITATGQPVYQRGFEPLVPGFVHVPPNNLEALRNAVTKRTCAILLEPIQGEGGVVVLDEEFLHEARRLCDQHDLLLMFDEVQVGMGRTGTLFAYEQTGVCPDVICLAKALGNGLPIGAMASTQEVMKHLPPGSHASTFGGNPVACAGAKVVMEILTSPGFLKGVKERSEYLKQGLDELASEFGEKIEEVRGRGFIQAVVLRDADPGLGMRLFEKRVLALLGHGRILRLLPPLIVDKKEIDGMLSVLREVLK